LAFGPDRLSVDLNINGPGDPFVLDPVTLTTDFGPATCPPTARCWAASSTTVQPYPCAATPPRSAGASSIRSWRPGDTVMFPCESTRLGARGRPTRCCR